MIKVLFFARIREQLGRSVLELELDSTVEKLCDLQNLLIATYGQEWEQALAAPNVVRAVNQEVVELDCAIEDGDEVAFFPPVTGG